MTQEEYFNQEMYFSESAQELISIESMAFPHAFYAWRKLAMEHTNAFPGSPLSRAFIQYLAPTPEKIRELLRTQGSAGHVHFGNTTPVRSKFYHAAKVAGLKVTTHKEENWVTAHVVVDTVVKVRGRNIHA